MRGGLWWWCQEEVVIVKRGLWGEVAVCGWLDEVTVVANVDKFEIESADVSLSLNSYLGDFSSCLFDGLGGGGVSAGDLELFDGLLVGSPLEGWLEEVDYLDGLSILFL